MHTGAFAAAGQRLADTDDSFSSAPRGILIGQIPQILRAKKFDGTRGGQRLDIWLEEIDKAIIVNPDVFRQWKGDATDRSIAEQSLPRKLADLAQVVVNNLSMRSGSDTTNAGGTGIIMARRRDAVHRQSCYLPIRGEPWTESSDG